MEETGVRLGQGIWMKKMALKPGGKHRHVCKTPTSYPFQQHIIKHRDLYKTEFLSFKELTILRGRQKSYRPLMLIL